MHRSHRLPSWRMPVAAISAAIGLVACTANGTSPSEEVAASAQRPVSIEAAHRGHGSVTHRELSAADRQAIAQVRNATAKYHDIRKAQANGYSVQYPAGCAASAEGGQGFHWLNEGLVDEAVDLLQPELVMYEPQPGGSMKLVGVDYIVPYVEGSTAPTLLNRAFAHLGPPLNVWALHIWAWEPNESGMFAMWNPSVSCEFAD